MRGRHDAFLSAASGHHNELDHAIIRFKPILALATESQQARRDEAKRSGASGWLVEPVGSADLVKVIPQLLPKA